MPIVLDGTTNTVTPLTASGVATFTAGSAAAPALTTAGDTNTGIFFPAADTIAFSEGGVESMRIDSVGNLLVGTASVLSAVSNYKTLQVTGTSGGIVDIGSNSTIYGRCSADSAGMNVEATVAGTPVFFRTGGTERMRVDASGNLLVGTTSVIDLGKTNILFGGSTQNGIAIQPTDATANAGYIVFDNNSGTRIGSIIRNGATNAVLYNTTSDYRMKEQVQPLTNALDKVIALKPVSWVWKDCDGALGQGFIAHEVQEIIPSAVSGEKDAVYEDGSIKPQGMDASYLVATLTAAIQELNAKFEEYKASHP